MVRVRFAPSPTGALHVGNARTALINALYALSNGGEFLLRFDDTDRERCRSTFADAIRDDLRWLGLSWSQEIHQSSRLDRYREVARQLRDAHRLYPCWESRDELEYKRKRQLARRQPPIYDRAALRLSEAEKRALEASGRQPHWRFLLQPGEIAWDDLVRGRVSVHGEHLSDPVVVREDGTFLYLLPSVIDDRDFAITHVIRGEDHVTNTAVQIQMAQAVGASPPVFAHLPLMTDIMGAKVSKRLGVAMSLAQVREEGIEPMALNAYLAALGTGEPPRRSNTIAELAEGFDIRRYGRAAPKFDPEQLDRLSERALHETDFDAVAGRLSAMGLGPDANERFWTAIRGNLTHIEDARAWYEVCFGTIAPIIDDAEFAEAALRQLPAEPWDEATWDAWVAAVREVTGRRGKNLFQPLRRALTGCDHGPELKRLLPLIGRPRAARRLRGEGIELAQAAAVEPQAMSRP